MKYAFLTMLIPTHIDEEVRNLSKNNMQDAANVLQWHIYEGLCDNFNERIKIFNVLPIGSFPQYYSKPFIKKSLFDDEINKAHVNIGFCNIKLIRKWHQPKKIFEQLKKWCSEDEEDKTLFVYTVSAQFLIAISRLKSLFPKLRVCAIVADLPDMSNLSSNKSFVKKLFEKSMADKSYSLLSCIDSFVLLTKQMAEYMHIEKPYVVVEGISTAVDLIKTKKEDNVKRILYTGTLHKRFGVYNLLKAFEQIESPDYRLIICGVGDTEAEIINMAKIDKRIDFRGQLKREDVLKLQSQASVLVNPRQNNEEFTKYSFPSKNLEYLSSGIPLVAYKLDGIPDEYDEYINYVKDDSIEALRDILIEICEDSQGIAAQRAEKAAYFVRDEKNSQKQTMKIKKMINDIL